MKEAEFINRNKEKWAKFALLSDSQASDPKVVSKQYVELTEDLSHAQTFFEKRSVRVYLNDLSKKVFTSLHKQKADSFSRFLDVWRVSLPLELYRSRKNLTFALVMFLIWGSIGFVTTQLFPEYAKTFLGSQYVAQTVDNIANGDPLAIYESNNKMQMFIQITSNNIRVSLLMFILGITFTFGTHYLLMTNGIMVGVFQGFFVAKGLGLVSFLGIWLHGAFEISSIVIAAAAGFTLGNAWLFPGSFSRFESLQIGAKRGVKIALSIVPFLIAAGWIESFVTANYQDYSTASKVAIITLSFGLILYYFIIFPIIVSRKYPERLNQEYLPSLKGQENPTLFKIRSIGDIISESVNVYRNTICNIVKFNLITTLPILALLSCIHMVSNALFFSYFHYYDWYSLLLGISGLAFESGLDFISAPIFMFALCNLICSTFYFMLPTLAPSYFQYFKIVFFKVYLVLLCSLLFLSFSGGYLFWTNILLLPIPMILISSIAFRTRFISLPSSKNQTFLSQNYGVGIAIAFTLIIFFFFFAQIIAVSPTLGTFTQNTDVLDALCSFVSRILSLFKINPELIVNGIRLFVYFLFIIVVFPLGIIMFGLQFHSTFEMLESPGLRQEIDQIGKSKKSHESIHDYA